jgi:glycosyltransferase involved in cell wall biosynthesis
MLSTLTSKFKKRIKHYIRKFLVILVNLRIIKKNISPISFIAEKHSWAIHWEGLGIAKKINELFTNPIMVITSKVYAVRSPIIHFGSQYMWEIWRDLIPKQSKVIVNFFHGDYEDGHEVAMHISDFIANHDKIDKIVVSNTITHNRLIKWGIPKEKIIKIYIGVDSKLFSVNNMVEKLNSRKLLGYKKSDFIIGSFQKDGIGWKGGLSPKLIKGPDILVETLSQVAKVRNIKVLLTGPSRGYVVKGLTTAGVDFQHFQLDNYLDLPVFYKALDLYLITSREEGGPKGLIEALSSSVPVVSTPVGMSNDLLEGLEGCALTSSFSVPEIVTEIIRLIDTKASDNMFRKWPLTIRQVDYSVISSEYFEKIYSQLRTSNWQ